MNIKLGKPGDFEPSNIAPSIISPEAWDSAGVIDEAVEALLIGEGMVRKSKSGATKKIVAMAVQFAINRSHAVKRSIQ